MDLHHFQNKRSKYLTKIINPSLTESRVNYQKYDRSSSGIDYQLTMSTL